MTSEFSFSVIPNETEEAEVVIDLAYNQKTTKSLCSISREKKICCGLLLSILLIFLTACLVTTIFFPIYFTRSEPLQSPKYSSSDDIIESVEFQIGLRPHDAWSDREKMFKIWINSTNEYAKYFQISRESGIESIYAQSHIESENGKKICGSTDFSIRERKYMTEEKITIDIKGGDDIKEKEGSCNQPFWPSKEHYNVSRQKCEEDVHACFSKFSRGTSVTFASRDVHFYTCTDLANVFPYAFVPSEDPVSLGKGGFWYKLQWIGAVDNMNYEIQFTLKYDEHASDVITGGVEISEGEWSLRFWADRGEIWSEDVVQDFQTVFYKLVLEFDLDYEDHQECAIDFLNGDGGGIKFEEHEDRVKDW